LRNGQVQRLITIIAKVIEFPWLALRSDRFPVSNADGLVAVVEPPERLMKFLLICAEGGDETFPGSGGASGRGLAPLSSRRVGTTSMT